MWSYHIPVPLEIAEQFVTKKSRRVICTLNNLITVHIALTHDGIGGFYITLNKENRKKLKVVEGDSIKIDIKKDESKYGMPMPEEFEVMLEQEPDADRIFHKLTPGKQRTLLHLIGKYKNSETRITKALVVANYLIECNGKIDFKALNADFKAANQK